MQDQTEARTGEPNWRRNGGRALLATLATALIFVFAIAAASGVTALVTSHLGYHQPGAAGAGVLQSREASRLGIFLLAMQATTVALTIAAARLFARDGTAILPMRWPPGGLGAIVVSSLGLLVLASILGILVYALDLSALAGDMKPFAEMARTSAWWVLLLAAALGAPLAEELLFRGFLYANLRPTALGYAGSALLTSVLWSALHANYSVYGVAMIVIIGLYFARLREKSGSLVPSIAAHALYNGTIVLALALTPQDFTFAP